MSFDLALKVSEVLHYSLVLIPLFLFIIRTYKNFISLVLKSYLIFFIWGVICYIFQGCPLTLSENWLSTQIYGKPFYPNYVFKNTDFYYLATNTDFYIPGVLVLITIFIKNKSNLNGISTSSNAGFS